MVNVRVTRKAREQTATLFYAGSTPVAYSNDLRLVHIMVIIADCLSVDGSSILLRCTILKHISGWVRFAV